MAQITLVEAVNLALARSLASDPEVVVLGQDVGRDGGVFRATLGLLEKFGSERVIDMPLAENLIVGMSIGMAVEGLKPVCEIQFAGFAYTTIDQLLNHAGRMRHRTQGRLACPMVMRMPCGAGIHAPEHHSESPDAMFAHIPGIRVIYPSSPKRAYGLLLAAIRDPDPVVFLEPTRLYRLFKEEVADSGEALALDTCFTLREGNDLTLVTWGAMVHESLQAADELAEQGIAIEVIDVATLKPVDFDTILASVARTGRCVVVTEAPHHCSIASEIAATLAEQGLLTLLAPVQRVTAPDVVVPFPRLEHHYLPDKRQILAAVRKTLEFA
ncbi:MAG: alpha-ketoacid dehydrogenase subunit beta [Betaproteobacteria bacterium]|nr:alpha-ketoacid dehydrogenase subunit beta [Betaproteobacteria bacterium]